MKKRVMKKWIPKNTCYCYSKKGICKWYKYLKGLSSEENHEKVFRCEYLGYTDYEQDSLLFNKCKECGIKDY